MEFIGRPQLPTGLAEAVAQLKARTPTPLASVFSKFLTPMAQTAEKVLGAKLKGQETLKEQKELLKEKQALEMIDMDDLIRQSAQSLGYKMPLEMKTIQKDLAETLVRGAAQLKVSESRLGVWQERIGSAGKTKDLELLRKYREDVVSDFNLMPDQRSRIISQIDEIMQAQEIGPRKKKLGIPEKKKEESGLPGLEVF